MKRAAPIRPISYLEANAAEVLEQLGREREPLVITQNGEARAVLQDVVSYEQTQETLALLKVLALGTRQGAQGRVVPAREVVRLLRERITGEEPSTRSCSRRTRRPTSRTSWNASRPPTAHCAHGACSGRDLRRTFLLKRQGQCGRPLGMAGR